MLCGIRAVVAICHIFLSLTGEVHAFEALDSDPMLVKLIDAQCPVGGRVELKLGAQVSVCIHTFVKDQQNKWHEKNKGIADECME